MELIAALGVLAILCLTFYCGVIAERIRWNALIHKGILPKPNKR